jgi:hypothetical protein
VCGAGDGFGNRFRVCVPTGGHTGSHGHAASATHAQPQPHTATHSARTLNTPTQVGHRAICVCGEAADRGCRLPGARGPRGALSHVLGHRRGQRRAVRAAAHAAALGVWAAGGARGQVCVARGRGVVWRGVGCCVSGERATGGAANAALCTCSACPCACLCACVRACVPPPCTTHHTQHTHTHTHITTT